MDSCTSSKRRLNSPAGRCRSAIDELERALEAVGADEREQAAHKLNSKLRAESLAMSAKHIVRADNVLQSGTPPVGIHEKADHASAFAIGRAFITDFAPALGFSYPCVWRRTTKSPV